MDKQAFLDRITEIGTCEDNSSIRTMLAGLSDEVSAVFDENDSLSQSNTNFENQVKQLQEDNLKLFLQVSNNKPQENPGEESPRQKLKYEDLFNEKGELK